MAKRQAAQAAIPAAKKAKQVDAAAAAAAAAAPAPSASEPEFKNKEKVLVLSTRGITFRCRKEHGRLGGDTCAYMLERTPARVCACKAGVLVRLQALTDLTACLHVRAALMAGTAT